MDRYTHVVHSFEPVFNEKSRVLILGSLPSVKSREDGFYYGHPRNRFWTIMARIAERPLPITKTEKKSLLLSTGTAVWDVVAECDIIGSSDASIKNVIPADLDIVLSACSIEAIFANGSTAAKLYNKYQRSLTGRDIITLPSTSPANAAWSTEKLTEAWKSILKVQLRQNDD